ncbi:MAG: hypothetical protein RDU25_01950 [Patescibacteria group bacterium]|nr:hypothetical protein [Patescibacteria group bacterium]
MPKKQSFSPKTNAPLAIFATILVVAGIVASAWFSSHKPSTPPSVLEKKGQAPAPINKDDASFDLFLENESSITILWLDGKSERLSKDDFRKRYPQVDTPLVGVSAANGAPTTFVSKADAVTSGEMDPSGAYVAHLGQSKSDGAGTIEISENNTVSESIVLRDKTSRPLKDPTIIGWTSPREMVVSVVATGTRYAYTVDRDGRIDPLAYLPDEVIFQDVRCGRLWYSTGVLGQGLESVPTGPSDFISVLGEQTKLIVHDEKRTLGSFVCAVEGVAYRMDDGESFYLSYAGGPPTQPLGKRTPLAVVGDGQVVMRENFDIVLFDVATGQIQKLMDVPEGEVKVFAVPKLFDL